VYFQQKPNIYENAKAFLRFTPGKLHSQQLQSDINVNGCQAKKQKKMKDRKNQTQPRPKLNWQQLQGDAKKQSMNCGLNIEL